MSISNQLYPANPVNVPISVAEVSLNFKTEVKKVLASIIFFFMVYILLLALSLLLAGYCIYFGISIVIAFPRIYGILAGIGIASIGVMVFFFLIKFIFAVNKKDESSNIEIREVDQPKLFAFIRQLTIDT